MAEVGSREPGRSFGFWLLHIGLPAGLLAAALWAGYAGGDIREIVLDSNTGVRESLTGLATLAAGVIVAVVLVRSAQPLDWRLKTWLVLFVAAMIFFAGEDLNWGQHYFGWTAPDYFLEHNREEEINIHNMWPLLFNRLPRAVVNTWLIVACILVPLGWRLPVRLTQSFVPAVLWPDRRLVFGAALVFAIKGLRHFSSGASGTDNWLIGMRHSELEELIIACVLLLYALMLRERLMGQRDGAVA